MNDLVHFLLAGDDDELRLGNLLGDFVKGRVQAGAQPWASAYSSMTGSRYASLSRTPAPRAVVECGSFSNPNFGCTDEREDAIAAYTDALAWYISGNAAYAKGSPPDTPSWR